jgi:hypothetical protein
MSRLDAVIRRELAKGRPQLIAAYGQHLGNDSAASPPRRVSRQRQANAPKTATRGRAAPSNPTMAERRASSVPPRQRPRAQSPAKQKAADDDLMKAYDLIAECDRRQAHLQGLLAAQLQHERSPQRDRSPPPVPPSIACLHAMYARLYIFAAPSQGTCSYTNSDLSNVARCTTWPQLQSES